MFLAQIGAVRQAAWANVLKEAEVAEARNEKLRLGRWCLMSGDSQKDTLGLFQIDFSVRYYAELVPAPLFPISKTFLVLSKQPVPVPVPAPVGTRVLVVFVVLVYSRF